MELTEGVMVECCPAGAFGGGVLTPRPGGVAELRGPHLAGYDRARVMMYGLWSGYELSLGLGYGVCFIVGSRARALTLRHARVARPTSR